MTTDNIFKFVSLRPPHTVSDENKNKRYVQYEGDETEFQKELRKTRDNSKKAVELSKRYMTSDRYNPDFVKLNTTLQKMLEADTVKNAIKTFETNFETDIDTFLKHKITVSLVSDLWDSLYAQVVLNDRTPEDRNNIFNGIRSLHYLKLLLLQDANDKPQPWIEYLKIKPTIKIDDIVFTIEDNGNIGEMNDAVKKEITAFKKLHEELVGLKKVIDDLNGLGNQYRAEEKRDIKLDLTIKKQPKYSLSSFFIWGGKEDSGKDIIILPAKKPWMFDDFGKKNLEDNTAKYLNNNLLQFSAKEDIEIISDIYEKMELKVKDYFIKLPKVMVSYILTLPEYSWIINNISGGYYFNFVIPPIFLFPIAPTGESRGIKPLGIGDLMVVKQELLKYTMGDVAHIENVLESEHKSRIHTRIDETEETIITETEQIEENERDLQSTQRYELQRESQETIENDMKLQAGFNISASYGTVTASAHGDFTLSQSSSESKKNASTFAKEIIDRSVSKILNKSREEHIKRTLRRIEERNEHGFNNSEGDDHVIGVYRWVNKFYKARVINYGRRLMFEFIIPEPAAFYLHTQKDANLEGVTLTKPEPPEIWGRPLEHTDLTRTNYSDYVSAYKAQDVEPYPERMVSISSAAAEAPGAGGNNNVDFAATSDKLKIPNGYEGRSMYGIYTYSGYADKYIDVFVAGESFTSASVSDVEGVVPISASGWGTTFNVSVTVRCALTEQAIEKWRLKTYHAIMNAYQNALSDYNEQVASVEIQSGVNIQGRNPEINRKVERDELRKSSLRTLTNNFNLTIIGGTWHYNEKFDAMKDNQEYNYPEFDINEAQKESKIIQFFEQCFEWNNMTYRFYPYFWGRKPNWDETFTLDDTDPSFTDFLRAGSARVVVPVHPSYNEAILYYLKTNKIWNDGEPPTIDDPLYISIIEEIKADTNEEMGEDLPTCDIESGYPCLTDEWDVKIPTNLTYLQEDSELPDFTEES